MKQVESRKTGPVGFSFFLVGISFSFVYLEKSPGHITQGAQKQKDFVVGAAEDYFFLTSWPAARTKLKKEKKKLATAAVAADGKYKKTRQQGKQEEEGANHSVDEVSDLLRAFTHHCLQRCKLIVQPAVSTPLTHTHTHNTNFFLKHDSHCCTTQNAGQRMPPMILF